MQKGAEGFENVTAINTRLMNMRPGFVFGTEPGEFAMRMLYNWSTRTSYALDTASVIIDDITPLPDPLAKGPTTLANRAALRTRREHNEYRIKLRSVIEHEEAKEFDWNETLRNLYEIGMSLKESTDEYDAIYAVTMLYRAHLRRPDDTHIDPLPLVNRIMAQRPAAGELEA